MDCPKHLDPDQWRAVSTRSSRVLVLAGAGSGKTRVLTERIVFLIKQGVFPPDRICALTFTNKAAREMHRRIVSALISLGCTIDPQSLVMTTFHSLGLRLIKEFAGVLGLEGQQTIYDEQDQVALIKRICQEKGLNSEEVDAKLLAGYFARAKERYFDAFDRKMIRYFDVFEAYQEALASNRAMDFADMLLGWYRLLSESPVSETLQRRWDCILVDEFQDTNALQFSILKKLAQGAQHLFVVGDEDQSIYKFRGAVVENILGFDRQFQDVEVIQLKRNYRSTQCIVKAAQHVINRNQSRRLSKEMMSVGARGDPIEMLQLGTDRDEAQVVVDRLLDHVSKGRRLTDIAVFYRTHSMSRLFEEALRRSSVPYRVFGGVRFYERSEVKDVLAYLKLIVNPFDSIALKRIINKPNRKIGRVSLDRCEGFAKSRDMPLFSVIEQLVDDVGLSTQAQKGCKTLVAIIKKHAACSGGSLSDQVAGLLDDIGYESFLEARFADEAVAKIENVNELKNAIMEFEELTPDATIAAFLESLHLDQDFLQETSMHDGSVSLMTCHSAKGLEFPVVFLVGCEETLFPHHWKSSEVGLEAEDVEEERRLFYVAMTRAKQWLTLSYVQIRKVFGQDSWRKPSRFLMEVPKPYMVFRDLVARDARGLADLGPSVGENHGFVADALNTQSHRSGEFHYDYDCGEANELGQWVKHPVFGRGQIVEVEGQGETKRYRVRFKGYGVKRLSAGFASLIRMG